MKDKRNSKDRNRISRRKFINYGSKGLAVLSLVPVTDLFADKLSGNSSWPADASKYRFHMIGQAHIDPVWLWPWSEGISVVNSTFRSALDRMNENPDFCFTASSAQFYQWVADNDPSMLDEIRRRIGEGRWNIVGGWWVEPDMNMPSGEAMVRQGLYGQLTMQRLTGHRATVAYCPDSFGHTNTLPQILKLLGMENYIFMRPAPKEKSLPADLFWWEGVDGSRVLTYRIPVSYNDTGSVRNRVEQVLTQFHDQPVKSFMAFYGAGDHGGGATKENIISIESLKNEKDGPKVFFSTTDNYFKEVRSDKSLKLPVLKDDLQHHSVGCYTAESEIKKGNRQTEAALVMAEKMAMIGSLAWGSRYPKASLTSAWKRVLFLQFHDSLAGTSLPEHSFTAHEGYGFALEIAHETISFAIQKLEWQIASEDPLSSFLLVFNTHAWEVRSNLEYDLDNMGSSTRVEDERGNSLPHQWEPGSTETSRKRLIVSTLVPPMGYRQLRILKGEPLKLKNSVSVDNNVIENEFLRISFSEDGAISVFDKEAAKELFAGGATGCRAVIIDDPSDTWSHDIKSFSSEIGSFSKASLKLLESGPLRATMRVTASYGDSKLSIDWTIYSGSRFPEAKVTLDWHERLKMLKFSFPVDVASPSATYETAYGHIVRSANGDEDPGQRWIDLTGSRNGEIYGLTVINDAKYGYSVAGNDMRISVARSSPYAHHNPKVLDKNTEHRWMDQGIQTFRMLLVPHTDSWKKSNIARIAEEFISPSAVIYQGIHRGSMPKSGSFLSVDSPDIIVSAIKQSEEGEDMIIRCVETSGQPKSAVIDLIFAGQKLKADFRPFEIKTFRVDKKYLVKEVNLLEE